MKASMMNFKFIVFATLLLNQISFSQPIASAAKLGVETRYWVQLGSSFSFTSGDFNGAEVQIADTDESEVGAGSLFIPKVQKVPGYQFGIGAQIDRLHEIGLEYKSLIDVDDQDWSIYALKITYRYLFFKDKTFKPLLGGGFNAYRFTVSDGYQTQSQNYTAEGTAKGVHFDLGYGAYTRHVAFYAGFGYEIILNDAYAIEEDGFDLNPSAKMNQFNLFANLRFYFL
jgi:hypothetical protein